MQISSFILFMINLYKDNHVRACVCAFVKLFLLKKTDQKLLTGLLPNFLVVFLRQKLKSSLHDLAFKKNVLFPVTRPCVPKPPRVKLSGCCLSENSPSFHDP